MHYTEQQLRIAAALKEEARRLGFDACGIAEATFLEEEARPLEAWLGAGMHADMGYMERNFDKRLDPRLLVEGARSVISVLHQYYVPVERSPEAAKISRYAFGEDYHEVLKDKLYLLFEWLREEAGDIAGRVFTDSAPVLDRAWARRAGLGWQGKNSNLLNRGLGSYFFIAEIICDLPLPPDGPLPDYCGRCTRCIDACPTNAIVAPHVVDANRCLSYWTIEYRGPQLPDTITQRQQDWIYGCDVCQEVCPWNKFSVATLEPRFQPKSHLTDTPLEEWLELDVDEYRRRFKGSAVKRAKYEGLMRNIRSAAAGKLTPAPLPGEASERE